MMRFKTAKPADIFFVITFTCKCHFRDSSICELPDIYFLLPCNGILLTLTKKLLFI